jgi:hypothetical protein
MGRQGHFQEGLIGYLARSTQTLLHAQSTARECTGLRPSSSQCYALSFLWLDTGAGALGFTVYPLFDRSLDPLYQLPCLLYFGTRLLVLWFL